MTEKTIAAHAAGFKAKTSTATAYAHIASENLPIVVTIPATTTSASEPCPTTSGKVNNQKPNNMIMTIKPNSSVIVDGVTIPSFKKEIEAENTIEVEVATTGYKGGDSGHGGRTFFKVGDVSCTDIRPSSTYDGVEIILGGDAEMETFCEALRIGYEYLNQFVHPVREQEAIDILCDDDLLPSQLELRRERFAIYVNELCALYRKQRSLSGMGKIRDKHHITGLTKQQFFECDLNRAKGFVPRDFCDKVYAFILDTTKAIPAPKYNE